jgi:uncharacterized membrane-anchored protein YhcB (DUF1043 family)
MNRDGYFWLAMITGFVIGIIIGIMIAGASIGILIKGILSGMSIEQIHFNLNETKLVETAFKLGNWSNVTT